MQLVQFPVIKVTCQMIEVKKKKKKSARLKVSHKNDDVFPVLQLLLPNEIQTHSIQVHTDKTDKF